MSRPTLQKISPLPSPKRLPSARLLAGLRAGRLSPLGFESNRLCQRGKRKGRSLPSGSETKEGEGGVIREDKNFGGHKILGVDCPFKICMIDLYRSEMDDESIGCRFALPNERDS